MATLVPHGTPRVADAPHARPSRAVRVVAVTLLVAWAAVAVLVLCVDGRSVSYGSLRADVTDGRVEAVQVVGGLAEGSTGYAVVEVRWRSGPFAYSAEVVEASRGRSDSARSTGVAPVVRSVPGDLLALDPGLDVAQVSDDRGGVRVRALGVDLGGAGALACAAVIGATFLLVALGPEPRRATRWAWTWMLLSPGGPLAVLVVLALGGYLRAGPPAPGARRLTGGWALLLALVLGGLSVPTLT